MEFYDKRSKNFWVRRAFNTMGLDFLQKHPELRYSVILATQRPSSNYNEALDRGVRFPVYSL